MKTFTATNPTIDADGAEAWQFYGRLDAPGSWDLLCARRRTLVDLRGAFRARPGGPPIRDTGAPKTLAGGSRRRRAEGKAAPLLLYAEGGGRKPEARSKAPAIPLLLYGTWLGGRTPLLLYMAERKPAENLPFPSRVQPVEQRPAALEYLIPLRRSHTRAAETKAGGTEVDTSTCGATVTPCPTMLSKSRGMNASPVRETRRLADAGHHFDGADARHDAGDCRRARQDGLGGPVLIVDGVMDANHDALRIVPDGPDRLATNTGTQHCRSRPHASAESTLRLTTSNRDAAIIPRIRNGDVLFTFPS